MYISQSVHIKIACSVSHAYMYVCVHYPGICSKNLPDSQVVPRPQDSLLRNRPLPVLRHDRVWSVWIPHGRLLLQGIPMCVYTYIHDPMQLVFVSSQDPTSDEGKGSGDIRPFSQSGRLWVHTPTMHAALCPWAKLRGGKRVRKLGEKILSCPVDSPQRNWVSQSEQRSITCQSQECKLPYPYTNSNSLRSIAD